MQELRPLRRARLEAAKSQWDIAKETAIPQSLISLYERNLREPTENHKRILAQFYGKSFDELWPKEK